MKKHDLDNNKCCDSKKMKKVIVRQTKEANMLEYLAVLECPKCHDQEVIGKVLSKENTPHTFSSICLMEADQIKRTIGSINERRNRYIEMIQACLNIKNNSSLEDVVSLGGR